MWTSRATGKAGHEDTLRGRRRWIAAAAATFAVAAGIVGLFVLTRTDASKVPSIEDIPEQDVTDKSAVADPEQQLLQAARGDGPKPLIDPDLVVSGGPPPDGIPPIDHPRFVSASEIDWLTAREPVIAVVLNGDARAYPLQIMTWHEIVNDTVGGVPISVTFCPLCNTAYAFVRPEVDGEITSLGTSGLLYNSNLVMYDRATSSLWPQALGEAAIGPLTGTTLERIPARIVAWAEFREAFPGGDVLSRDTGFSRDYGENPYPGYDDVDNPPFLFSGEVDGRLAAVERVLGVERGHDVVAFPYSRLKDAARAGAAAVDASVAGEPIVVIWKHGTVSALDATRIASSKDVGASAAFSRRVRGRTLDFTTRSGNIIDEQTSSTWNLFGTATSGPLDGAELRPVDAHDSFWFDWAAFHPETRVWAGS